MKKKIVFGLSIFCLIFIFGGIYIITSIEKATSTLDNLIKLHKVEILREHLLIEIKKAQSDLNLKNTRFARGVDTVVTHVRGMKKVADTCFGCHHAEEILKKLTDMHEHIDDYMDALSRVFTIRGGTSRLETEEEAAFKLGEQLIAKVDSMIALSSKRLEKKTQIALKEIANTKIMLFLLVTVGPLLAIGLSIIFIRGVTKPISVLLGATRKLKGGDLDYRIVGLRDEFGEVAASFNEMLNSLKEQMFKMQRVEQMTIVGELAAGLAHEIKNPLAGIKISMQVLAETPSLAEEDRDILLKVIDQVRRIESLMKNLLDFAKPAKPQLSAVDVNNLLEMAFTFSLKYPSLAAKNAKTINMVKELDPKIPAIQADPMKLQQVFLNLLINAKDAMPEGGILTIKTAYLESAKAIQIEISDSGKGVDKDIMDKIFHPFFTTKPKGTGLGLAITKQLIEQHGGHIGVSNNPSGGALFRITFPFKNEERGPIE